MNTLLIVLSLAVSFVSASEVGESSHLRALTCTFVCPKYSKPKPNRSCINTFDDCKCIDGFIKSYETCIKVPSPTKRPTNAPYLKPTKVPTLKPTKRPTNKPTKKPTKAPTLKPTKYPTIKPTKKPTKLPTEKPTYAPIKYPTKRPTKYPIEVVKYPTKAPVKICYYICPPNSYPKDNECPKDFDDCKCKDGYNDAGYKEECIKEVDVYPTKAPVKNCVYICPVNSYPKDNNKCPKDFDDCKCKDGYDDSGSKDECVKDN